MTKLTRIQLALSIPLMATLLACGGGGGGDTTPPPPPPKSIADRLDFTPGTGPYTFVKDTSLSSQTHLVLNLVGPAGTGTGVGFILNVDSTKATWAKPAASDALLARNLLFDLGTATPQLGVAKATGDQLQVAFYQKGATKPAVTFTPSSVLATVALDLKANIPVGTVITLSAQNNKAIVLQGAAAPTTIVIAPGSIIAN